jgi:predicted phosphodiesterase
MGDTVELIDAPLSIGFEIGNKRVVMMHRHPENCWDKVPYFEQPYPEILDSFYRDVKGDILFFGHTHVPLLSVSGDRTYINPGSIGAENGGIASYTILEQKEDGSIAIGRRKVPYDIEKVRKDLKIKEVPYHKYIAAHFFRENGFNTMTVKDI